MEQPTVSICMITYGHEPFIAQAINGVLMQECDFEFELIIANDASPDDTDAIITTIIENHEKGRRIKYIKHDNNKGMMQNFVETLLAARGKFVALCEGDDYWTDPKKLSKQVAFLEANSEFVLSFHGVDILSPDGKISNDYLTKVPNSHETIADLATHGNYIHTPSVVYRNILTSFPEAMLVSPVGDYFLYMLLAEHGKLKYHPEVMAVYRYGTGVHSGIGLIRQVKNKIKLYVCLLPNLKDETIREILRERIFKATDILEDIIRKEYKHSLPPAHFFSKMARLASRVVNKIKKA